MRRALAFTLALTTLLLTACDRGEAPIIERRFIALGTIVDISLYAVDADTAETVLSGIEADFRRLHNDWHAWQPSELTRLNAALQEGEHVPVPPALYAALQQAAELNRRTDGLFEPAMGRLIEAWGFHGDDVPARLPDPSVIEDWLAHRPRLARLELADGRARSDNPYLQIDLGGFAKGIAVDRAIARLRAAGIDNAIVNAGGDLRAIGRRGRPWRIGIRHPRGQGVLAALEIRDDESVFTSGDYERHFEVDGRRYHHILDPRTGYPARGTASVTVIHSQAELADAAATALFVAGPGEWPGTAAALGIDQVLFVDTGGNVSMTPAMAERIRFQTPTEPPTEVVPLP